MSAWQNAHGSPRCSDRPFCVALCLSQAWGVLALPSSRELSGSWGSSSFSGTHPTPRCAPSSVPPFLCSCNRAPPTCLAGLTVRLPPYWMASSSFLSFLSMGLGARLRLSRCQLVGLGCSFEWLLGTTDRFAHQVAGADHAKENCVDAD